MVPNLPIDVWARVACFIEPECRTSTFMALRRAMLLPTYRSMHETMHRFLEEAARIDTARSVATHPPSWPTRPYWPEAYESRLCDMGFDSRRVVRALVMAGGDLQEALLHLVAYDGV